MTTATFILLIVAVLAVAFGLWMYVDRQRSRKLRGRFGPEYERAVAEHSGNTRRAEAALEQREKRVSKLHIHPMSAEERSRFVADWKRAQEEFVDDPRLAVARADKLVNEAMAARGYPMGEFEQRAADISVDHPDVCSNYRLAHDIALRDQRSQASTEELRQAMQHYRFLFQEVVESKLGEPVPAVRHEEVHQ